jgi:glycosyltransferase 2 family protein
MSHPRTEPGRSRLKALARLAAGWLLAILSLLWIFHDVHPRAFRQEMLSIRWIWVVPAVVFDIASYFCQGIRWGLILRPVARITPLRATQAIYAGLFTNEIFPMRLGEVVRSLLVSRWCGAGMASVFPSIAIERLFDALWLTIAIGLAAIFVPMPPNLVKAADLLGIIVVAGGVLLTLLVARAGGAGRASAGGPERGRLRRLIAQVAAELGRMGRTRSFYGALFVSSLVLLSQAIAFWMVMRAYGLGLSLWVGIVALLIVHLGTALPNAPGNVGTYQFFCVVALSFFGIEKARATGFSISVFVILTVPLWAVGSLALARSRLSLRTAREEAVGWVASSRGRAPRDV